MPIINIPSSAKYKTLVILGKAKTILTLNFFHREKWICLGDSLTKPLIYQAFLPKNKYKIINGGIAGCTLSNNGHPNSMCRRYQNLGTDNVKLITIMGGTNDFSQNFPIGSIDSIDDKTFCGALNIIINGYKKMCPLSRLILITPPVRNFQNNLKNKNGDSIYNYAQAMINVAKRQSVQVIDVCNQSGIDLNNLNTYTIDNIHLNFKGYKRIINMIKEVF